MMSLLDLPAPSFCLPNADQVEICLRDLHGKWIILYFYPKDNTLGCTQEACEFTAALPNIEQENGVVVGISPDSPKSHSNFIAKKELGILLLSDQERTVAAAYGAYGKKMMYGKETMGIIRSTFIIDPEGIVRAEWRNVKVKGHVEEVVRRLQELRRHQ
ncbi:MAG: peroxiredoxin [Campylobacterales bacterium]